MKKYIYNTPEVLKHLTVMEQHVLAKHFGLDDGEPRTLTDIGYEYELTRERVRQIKETALRKLRDPKIIRELVSEKVADPEGSATQHNNNTI